MRIIIKKNKKNNNKVLLLVNKHKIKDLVGFFSTNKDLVDFKCLTYKSFNGTKFSNSAKNIIYKYYYSNILENINKIKF